MSITLYFIANGAIGETGLPAWRKEKAHLALLQKDLAVVRLEKESLEKQTRALRDKSLDLDLLEEKARTLLKLSHERDYFIPYDRSMAKDEGF